MTTIERTDPSLRAPASASSWDRRAAALLVGMPIAWAALLLFHPTGDGDVVYPIISSQLERWMAVHAGMAVFIPLLALAGLRLVRGVDGVAARAARVLLPIGAVLYGLFEGILGIGAGALVDHVDDLSGADHAAGAALVEDFFMHSPAFRVLEYGGTLGLGGGLIAAAIALRHARTLSRTAAWLLGVGAVLVTMHVPPFGPVGLALFVTAVLLGRRSLLAPAGVTPASGPGAG